MFDQLHKIPWDQLEHSYGQATDVPRWIADLISDDECA
jgi:hypothetical protein